MGQVQSDIRIPQQRYKSKRTFLQGQKRVHGKDMVSGSRQAILADELFQQRIKGQARLRMDMLGEKTFRHKDLRIICHT